MSWLLNLNMLGGGSSPSNVAIALVKAFLENGSMSLDKNVAGQRILVYAFNSTTLAPVTSDSANITGSISIDGGAFAAFGTANPTEIGNGWYYFSPTQAETNGDALAVFASSVTANVEIVVGPIYTRDSINAEVVAALNSQGLTVARSGNLDNLDDSVSDVGQDILNALVTPPNM